MGRSRLHPDTLLSLLRSCSRLLSLLRRFVESRLHMAARLEKTKKRPMSLGTQGILDTWTLLKRTTALCCNTGQNNYEKKSIHIKNRAWSPSLLLPSVTFFTSVKSKMAGKKKTTRIPKIQKQLQEVKQTLPKVDVLVPKTLLKFQKLLISNKQNYNNIFFRKPMPPNIYNSTVNTYYQSPKPEAGPPSLPFFPSLCHVFYIAAVDSCSTISSVVTAVVSANIWNTDWGQLSGQAVQS